MNDMTPNPHQPTAEQIDRENPLASTVSNSSNSPALSPMR